MKKTRVLSLILLTLILLLTSCNTTPATSVNSNDAIATLTPNASTYSSDVQDITCTLTNKTDEELVYGEDYQLLKKENGIYTELTPINVSIQDISYKLEPNKSNEIKFNVAKKYGNLETGQYQLALVVSHKHTVTCEFTIE